MFVSKNGSTPLPGFEPVEAEVRRKPAAIFAQPREQRPGVRGSLDRQPARARHLDLDIVALGEAEGIDHRTGQTYGQAVAPFCYPHVDPGRYTDLSLYIIA